MTGWLSSLENKVHSAVNSVEDLRENVHDTFINIPSNVKDEAEQLAETANNTAEHIRTGIVNNFEASVHNDEQIIAAAGDHVLDAADAVVSAGGSLANDIAQIPGELAESANKKIGSFWEELEVVSVLGLVGAGVLVYFLVQNAREGVRETRDFAVAHAGEIASAAAQL